MSTVWTYALISVSMVSLISLAGVFAIPLNRRTLAKVISILVSLATGAMLANALVHLIPESFEAVEKGHISALNVSLLVTAGFVACFLLDRVLKLRCHHAGVRHESEDRCCLQEEDDSKSNGQHKHTGHIHPTGHLSIVAHALDNFTDGVLIGLTYIASIPSGVATTVAVILHEIPMEFGGFGVLVNAGFSRTAAIAINVASGLVAVVGTVVVLLFGSVVTWLPTLFTPVGAGIVLYITASGLIPQLQQERCLRKSAAQFGIMMLGIAAMVAVRILFEH